MRQRFVLILLVVLVATSCWANGLVAEHDWTVPCPGGRIGAEFRSQSGTRYSNVFLGPRQWYVELPAWQIAAMIAFVIVLMLATIMCPFLVAAHRRNGARG